MWRPLLLVFSRGPTAGQCRSWPQRRGWPHTEPLSPLSAGSVPSLAGTRPPALSRWALLPQPLLHVGSPGHGRVPRGLSSPGLPNLSQALPGPVRLAALASLMRATWAQLAAGCCPCQQPRPHGRWLCLSTSRCGLFSGSASCGEGPCVRAGAALHRAPGGRASGLPAEARRRGGGEAAPGAREAGAGVREGCGCEPAPRPLKVSGEEK